VKKLKGPELKMPALKTPAFLNDLYYDLRDRRLLPVVALVIVAIAAVPFLLGGSEETLVPRSDEPLSSLGEADQASRLTVVEATPGLRDYRKRLGHLSPSDPFKQRYTGLPPSAQLRTSSSEAEGSGAASPTVSEGSESQTVESGGSESGGSPSGESEAGSAQKYEFVIDAQVSRIEKTADGEEKVTKTEERHGVPIFGELPSKKISVAKLLGANVDKRRLVFLVSHDVDAVTGEFGCITRGAEVCEILEVDLGAQLEYLYEPTGVRYAIKVTNARVVPIGSRKGASSSRAAFIGLGGASFPSP
jgi:hypothetical protein